MLSSLDTPLQTWRYQGVYGSLVPPQSHSDAVTSIPPLPTRKLSHTEQALPVSTEKFCR